MHEHSLSQRSKSMMKTKFLTCAVLMLIPATLAWMAAEEQRAEQAAEVTVTVYFGGQARATLEKSVAHRAGMTALDALAAAARIETNAERTFVRSIEGVANSDAHKEYWLYFVNGQPMHVGAAETRLKPGDRVLWFLRRASSTGHAGKGSE
jgi:hypothetical protein